MALDKRYVFFDIECCDGQHICSFGYVVTDAEFNIIEKRDILINPQKKFRLARAGFDPYVELAYPEKQFENSPAFSAVYEDIKAILLAPNAVLFGHSVESDMKYLEVACARYGKKKLGITVIDLQAAYAKYAGEKTVRSLSYITSELGADVSHLKEHKSCDDAEMTAAVARSLCSAQGMTAERFTESNADCCVNDRAIAVRHQSAAVRKALKSLRKTEADGGQRRNVYISESVLARDKDARLRLVRAAYKKGYGFTVDVRECAYFVSNGASTVAESEYLRNAVGVKKIGFDMLGSMLGVKIDGHGEIAAQSAPKQKRRIKRAPSRR